MELMASWSEITADAPEFAAAVEASFAQGRHKIMATLRADGSPRVSGTEVDVKWGDLWFGSMPGAVKAKDLQRDPRMAVHSPPIDETMAIGDAKISGRAVEITDAATFGRFVDGFAEDHGAEPPQPFHLFRIDVTEVVRTTVAGEQLVVESWHPGRGYRRIERTG